MADTDKGCRGLICCLVHIFLNAFDTFTDCTTLMVYWKNETVTVFTLALLSLVVSFPVTVASYVYQFKLCTGRINTDEPVITLKLVGILFESLPQLMINLYVLALCKTEASVIQWISAAVSFLAICVAIIQYDISARIHRDIETMQKIFLVAYRVSYLAARILSMIYFVYVLEWWIAAIMTAHWLIGLVCIMKDRVDTVVRSLAFVFLNTFIYIGEFAGVTALFVLILYVMENLIMTAIAYIVSSQTITAANDLSTTAARFTTPSGIEGVAVENDFFVPNTNNRTSDSGDTNISGSKSCPNFGILAVHIGLNVVAVVMCCFYNVWFHYTACKCNGGKNVENTGAGIERDEERASFQVDERP